MSDKRPLCPNCELELTPHGHVNLTTPVAERVRYYACAICGYQTEEVRTPFKFEMNTPKVRR